jgi:hypothetical protein
MMSNNIPNYEGCQYIGENQDPRIHWPIKSCGCEKIEDTLYCEDHIGIVYQSGTALRKRHKDIKRAEAIWSWESLMNEVVDELENEGVDFS